jgi:DNA-binding MarR family transcriptional regulator
MKNELPSFVQNLVAPNVGRTAKYINSLIKSRFEENEIPLSKEQYIVLLRVENEPKPQKFLANVTERDKGSLTRLVQSLEKKQLVKRKICQEDSRVNKVEITKRGTAVLNQVKPLMISIYESLHGGINAQEKEITLKVLSIIQENAMKEIKEIERLSN